MIDFRSMGLSERTLTTLEGKGFTEPTEIQARAIPLLMEGNIDIIAQAQTGTGKTAVFALPLIEKLDHKLKHVQAIILAPTRELVIQVTEEIDSLKGGSDITTAAIYGGQRIDIQLKKLRRGSSIVVGTPGRILDHIRRGTLILDKIEYFILDEADEMLNMGFIEDIEEVLKETPDKKRVLLFSATMPARIRKLAENYMGKYEHIRSEQELTTDLTEQIFFEVKRKEKLDALVRILQIEGDFYGIVFCRTKADVDELTNALIEKGLKADNLHGDISQPLREKILGKFRDRKINILVATDVAARGIDVDDLTHVINYSIPQNPEAYVHRIGRTGRAGKQGTALTFVTPAELRRMKFIQKFTKADIKRQKVPGEHDVMELKKEKLQSNIETIISDHDLEEYRKWAKDLLEGSSEEDLISALLKYSFSRDQKGVDMRHRDGPPKKKMVKERKEPADRKVGHSENRENRGSFVKKKREVSGTRTTRLSLAMGKKDHMNVGKVKDLINHKAGTDPLMITDVEIRGDRTFFTVPRKEAKSILKFFRRTKKNDAPLIKKVETVEDKRKGQKRYRKEKGRFVRS